MADEFESEEEWAAWALDGVDPVRVEAMRRVMRDEVDTDGLSLLIVGALEPWVGVVALQLLREQTDD